jgi:SOS-response transcriptional repressor LexA
MDEQKTTIRPTKKQQEMLVFIDEFISAHGYSPSYREVASGLNYTSVATVALHINNLIKRGHLAKRDHSARSLEVIKSAPPKEIVPKQLKASEEKWLVKKVEQYFRAAEDSAAISERELDELYVLIGALKVLGLDGAANSFIPRLSAIKKTKEDHKYTA